LNIGRLTRLRRFPPTGKMGFKPFANHSYWPHQAGCGARCPV